MDILQNGDCNVVPTETDIVASFNWSSRTKRHIIVPGAPPRLVTSRQRFHLTKDADSFDNLNLTETEEEPMKPMEPLFHSLGICSPEFDLSTVDIVTDRHCLWNLLRFCRSPGDTTSTSEFGERRHFKLFVHAVGDAGRDGGQTLVFTRAAVADQNVKGYVQNFEEVLTEKEPGSPPDAGTFRLVVKMNLGGMVLLVQSRADACEQAAGGAMRSSVGTLKMSADDAAAGAAAKASAQNDDDPLDEKLETLLVLSSPEGGKSKPKTSSGLTSTKSGQLLGDGAQMVKLKTKNSRYADQINWRDIYWLLALGGAQKLVLGLHNRGRFGVGDVKHYPISEVKDRAGEASMVFLTNTLRDIIKAAHRILATTGSAGAPPAPSSPSPGGEAPSRASTTAPVAATAAVIVEYTPSDDSIRVRPADDSDVAPS